MKKMMRILIGYDGSPESLYLFEDLKMAGLPERVEVLIVTAMEMNIPGMVEMVISPPTYILEDIEKLRNSARANAAATARSAVRCLSSIFPKWKIYSEVSVEPAVWALVNKAEKWKADLIVVGARSHSKMSRFMGSVSQLVLMHAPCSVRVVRAPILPSVRGMKILVAIDGSLGAGKALKAAEARKWPLGSKIRLLTALPNRSLKNITPKFPTNLRYGDPKEVLVEEAKTWGANCIFLGARGLSPTRRFFLGSVSLAVAARAGCSVEIVR